MCNEPCDGANCRSCLTSSNPSFAVKTRSLAMKMAVITFPGHTFEQMFARWSPFFAEGTCESTYYMLRQGLKERGIELVSTGARIP